MNARSTPPRTALTACAIAIALLGVLAYALQHSQARARAGMEAGVRAPRGARGRPDDERAVELGAGAVQAGLRGPRAASPRRCAAAVLQCRPAGGGPRQPRRAARDVAGGQSGARSRAAPAVRRALRGRFAISDLQAAPARAAAADHARGAVRHPEGRRVGVEVVGGDHLELRVRVPRERAGDPRRTGYLIDGNGRVLARRRRCAGRAAARLGPGRRAAPRPLGRQRRPPLRVGDGSRSRLASGAVGTPRRAARARAGLDAAQRLAAVRRVRRGAPRAHRRRPVGAAQVGPARSRGGARARGRSAWPTSDCTTRSRACPTARCSSTAPTRRSRSPGAAAARSRCCSSTSTASSASTTRSATPAATSC